MWGGGCRDHASQMGVSWKVNEVNVRRWVEEVGGTKGSIVQAVQHIDMLEIE